MNKMTSPQFIAVLWQNGDGLKALSTWLQWISISLVFVSGALQLVKFLVDRREKQLQVQSQLTSEANQRQRERALSSTVQDLKKDLATRQSEIEDLSKRTVHLDPLKQPISAGTATVEVLVASGENVNSNFMDRGGYIGFGKGSEALMFMVSTQCNGNQLGNNQVRYRGVFTLDAAADAIGKPASFLNQTEYIQVSFLPIPEDSEVISGKAICTINNTIRFEITIPAQKMQKEKILAQVSPSLVTNSSAKK